MYIEKEDFFTIDNFWKYGVQALYTKKNFKNILNYLDLKKSKNINENNEKNENFTIESKLGLANREFFYGGQTHSSNIKVIKEGDVSGEYSDTDGFITNRRDVVLLAQYADCLPIYFYDINKEVIGLVHAGWKGSFNKIQIEALKLFKNEYNSQLNNIVVALGIGMKSCCYEVGQDFFDEFNKKFSKDIIDKAFKFRDNKHYFDSEEFNYRLLIENGILEKNIIKSNICIFCSNKFFSFRKNKTKNRNAALMFFK